MFNLQLWHLTSIITATAGFAAHSEGLINAPALSGATCGLAVYSTAASGLCALIGSLAALNKETQVS